MQSTKERFMREYRMSEKEYMYIAMRTLGKAIQENKDFFMIGGETGLCYGMLLDILSMTEDEAMEVYNFFKGRFFGEISTREVKNWILKRDFNVKVS